MERKQKEWNKKRKKAQTERGRETKDAGYHHWYHIGDTFIFTPRCDRFILKTPKYSPASFPPSGHSLTAFRIWPNLCSYPHANLLSLYNILKVNALSFRFPIHIINFCNFLVYTGVYPVYKSTTNMLSKSNIQQKELG